MEAFYDRAHQVELTTVDVNDNDHIVPCSFHEFYSSVRRAAFALAISLPGRWAGSLVSLWLMARVLLRVALRVALLVLLRVQLRALLRVLLRVLLRMVLVLLMPMVLQPPRHPPPRRRRHRRSPTVDRSERSGADRIGSD